MPFTKNEQATLWFTDKGSGPPLLLIPGGLFDPINGKRFWEIPGVVDHFVTQGYRVLVPDRRYSTGSTSAPFEISSWEKEAADFAAVVHAAGGEAVSLVAGSNGCSAAIRFALAYPSLVHSFVLCWPVAPENGWLQEAIEYSAALVEQVGPAVYVDRLREQGVPRPGEKRGGFPFGFALLHDVNLSASFCSLAPHDAAQIIRESGHALLSGDLLRGVSVNEAVVLAAQSFPIWVMPAFPENPVHTLEIAQRLTGHIPGAKTLPGFPETPTPRFAAVRTEFCTVLQAALESRRSQE